MPSFNKVIIAGHITRDIELKYTAIARIGMAMNRKWKSEGGEAKEEVCFVDVTAFRKQAETMAQYLSKGRAVLVEGRLNLEQWEDKKTNEKRSKLGVVLESFSFLGGKGDGETKQATASAPKAEAPAEDPPF